MMIHEFFSMEAVNKYGTKFHELTLHKKIEVLQEFYDADLILLMNKIRVCGNQGAHYNLSLDLSNEEIKELVDQALGLFEYLLIKWFEINTIIKTEYTARIFSTIYLNVRIRVLEKLILIEKNNKNCQHENLMTLFHKYIIALVKSDRKNDAIQFFKDLHASGRININRSDYNKYIKSIDRLENGKKKGELAIANDMSDCKRNFDNVVKELSSIELKENEGLIILLEKLLAEFEPSSFDEKMIPNIMYL